MLTMGDNHNRGPPVITVLPKNQVFHVTEVHLALESAAQLASKGTTSVTVSFLLKLMSM